jgi:hypothetical protein
MNRQSQDYSSPSCVDVKAMPVWGLSQSIGRMVVAVSMHPRVRANHGVLTFAETRGKERFLCWLDFCTAPAGSILSS